MKKATFFVSDKIYQLNNIFDEKSILNRDDCLKGFINLKKSLKEKGYDLSTQDINVESESDFVIYNDFIPEKLINYNSYLILLESKLIKPENWNLNSHKKFKKIFTWNDDLVDNQKYFKINFSQDLDILSNLGIRKKFITQISANKISTGQHELYSERKKIIKWHEKQKFEFNFYGPGWNFYLTKSRILNYVLRKLHVRNYYKNYGGLCESKFNILKQYKYSYCLENYYGQNGYITEKIFDCFKSLTIPIYKGHKNSFKLIPKNTFINYDDFEDLQTLNTYLSNLTDVELLNYQKNIIKFLKSKKALMFSNDFFVDQIIKNIIID